MIPPSVTMSQSPRSGFNQRHAGNLALALSRRTRRDHNLESLAFDLNLCRLLLVENPELRTLWNMRKEYILKTLQLATGSVPTLETRISPPLNLCFVFLSFQE